MPTAPQLNGWVSIYKAAGASGIDPRRHSSKYYYSGGTVGIPYNIILDAKTLKVLEKKISYTKLEPLFQKYTK